MPELTNSTNSLVICDEAFVLGPHFKLKKYSLVQGAACLHAPTFLTGEKIDVASEHDKFGEYKLLATLDLKSYFILFSGTPFFYEVYERKGSFKLQEDLFSPRDLNRG